MPKPPPLAPTMDTKMDEILVHLRRLDRRDRLRTIGGFFRGLIGIIPVIILIGSVWYAYKYGDELLRKITEQAAVQAEAITKKNTNSLLDQVKGLIPR
ncbi:MAG: hypothetical protein V1926_03775 [Candidatus Peregrinibacteria bacterium]